LRQNYKKKLFLPELHFIYFFYFETWVVPETWVPHPSSLLYHVVRSKRN